MFLRSASTAIPRGKSLSGGIHVQNIPHAPVYPAGFAVYITLGSTTPREPDLRPPGRPLFRENQPCTNMAAKSVQTLVEDFRLLSEDAYLLVQAMRALTKKTLASVEEEVKYGGILFSASGVQFGGVFAYKAHVSVEFGNGASIKDPHGLLEGSGKGRRHIKLRAVEDITAKHLPEYLKLALQAARGA